MKRTYLFTMLLVFSCFLAFSQQKEIIVVSTNDLNMVFTATEGDRIIYNYFGNKLFDYDVFRDREFTRRPDNLSNFAPDLYPAYGGLYYQEPALSITHGDGLITTELIYLTTSSKSIDSNVKETIISLKDKLYNVFINVHFKAYYQENVISQWVEIRNEEKKDIQLHNFYSAYLPLYKQSYYLTHFHGTWAAEMQMMEEQLLPGTKKIETKKGVRTTQAESSSFLLSVNSPATEDTGEVYAGSLAWTGNYSLSFELDETGLLNILGGMNPFASTYQLSKGKALTSPEMIWTYSDQGKGQISRNYHDWTRKYSLYHGNDLRPILLNSWEGAYYSFDEDIITQMIDDAADLGIEMFVLDDGWFGNKYPRNSDAAGLGDWQINEKKLPRGINYLAEYANKKGLQFGLWIEPEMVNPQSELAAKHPDWIVQSGKRDIPTMRNQWLLDLSNPRVQDFIVKTFDDVISYSPYLSYIKWDANRHVDSAGSRYLPADKQSHFWIDYTKGLYSVYERIRSKHPDIMIQLCSSGGGRLDFGALKYHDEVWTSDNTSPMSRVFIQHGANMFFPAIATGSHVSASPNHQIRENTPIKFRFDIAMSGRLGMEINPKSMKADEIVFAKQAIKVYKQIRPIVQLGDLHRLVSPYDPGDWASFMYVAKDQKSAVLFAYSLNYHERTKHLELRLKGLDPKKKYKITELNNSSSVFWGNGKVFSGDYLLKAGINLEFGKMYDSAVFLIEEEK